MERHKFTSLSLLMWLPVGIALGLLEWIAEAILVPLVILGGICAVVYMLFATPIVGIWKDVFPSRDYDRRIAANEFEVPWQIWLVVGAATLTAGHSYKEGVTVLTVLLLADVALYGYWYYRIMPAAKDRPSPPVRV